MFVDSHVNLHGEKYREDLEEVVDRAREAGVGAMLAISDRLDHQDEIQAIAQAYDHMWHSVGVHPHHAKDYSDLDSQHLCKIAEASQAVGIGECGLDLYYEYSEIELQEPVFRAHIHSAQELNLPLIIHSRNADDKMIEMLTVEYDKRPFVPLMHCYTSGPELAKRALELGGYISFSGIITFKKADDVRAIAENTPLEKTLIETDCPYLTPVPFRGRRCEPAHVVHVAEKLAEIHNVSVEEIKKHTTDNFFQLFSKADRQKALAV